MADGSLQIRAKPIRAADLFCGAGGSSTGAQRAARDLGRPLVLTAVNHWQIAIDTHTRNHPGASHLCTDLEHLKPRDAIPDGVLDLLIKLRKAERGTTLDDWTGTLTGPAVDAASERMEELGDARLDAEIMLVERVGLQRDLDDNELEYSFDADIVLLEGQGAIVEPLGYLRAHIGRRVKVLIGGIDL